MGKIYMYYATMNGQKSADAIMKIHSFRSQGKHCLVFKPKLDTRDGSFITSRALKTRKAAVMIDRNEHEEMYQLTKDSGVKFIFVDEVQFFSTEQIEELVRIADELDVNIFCYGLLTDFRGLLFEGTKRLIECADSIREIVNSCSECNRKATRNIRLLNGKPVFDGEVIQVGYEESYKALCRKCYNEYKNGVK